jgi:hypothetical protein
VDASPVLQVWAFDEFGLQRSGEVREDRRPVPERYGYGTNWVWIDGPPSLENDHAEAEPLLATTSVPGSRFKWRRFIALLATFQDGCQTIRSAGQSSPACRPSTCSTSTYSRVRPSAFRRLTATFWADIRT